MTSDPSLIEDPAPLQTQTVPSEFINRSDEIEKLEQLVDPETSSNSCIVGERGTGKTHLVLHQFQKLPGQVNTCYVPCKRCDTEYKALKQLYQAVTREEISTGHHTSTLYREIEEKTTELPALVFLDDIEFLLQNDGDSLLYQLSRTNTDQLNLITASTPGTNLKDELEERTYSSLHPRRLELEPYDGEKVCQVLVQRSRDSLKPQSVHQNALTYIASTTQNLTYALTWLETTAKKSMDKITENKVREYREQAYKDYIDKQLREFTRHHRLLIQAIEELEKEGEPPIYTGEIYQRYHELSESYSEDPVSNRRLSTYLKHLELLQLIESKYHYGGQQGKTREIQSNYQNI